MFSKPKAPELGAKTSSKCMNLAGQPSPLKTPKKTYMVSGRIFVSSGFRVLRWFIEFLVAID